MPSREQSASSVSGTSIPPPQARAAHPEVNMNHGRDILGLRPAEWSGSTLVLGHKFEVFSCHSSLDSHITSGHIYPLDFRRLAGPTHQYSPNKEAAFNRLQSDATTGWNFATTVDPCQQKQQLSNSLANSLKNSKHHATALKSYQTPVQNSAAVADKIKAARLEAAQQVAGLEAVYGKEGAAEMMRIARMHPMRITQRHKATKYDLEVVAALDDPQDMLLSDST